MRRPLIYLLITFIAGIIAGYYFVIPKYLLFGVIIITLISLIVTIIKKWTKAGFLLIIFFTFLVGYFDIQCQEYLTQSDKHIIRYINTGKLTLEGVVIKNPVAHPDKIILVVRCQRIFKDKSYTPVSGNILLVIPPDLKFQYGDYIRFNSPLKNIRNFQNPGGFDYERYMNLQGIYATGFIANNAQIVLLRKNTASGIKLKLEIFRLYLKHLIYKNADSPHREIIEAMALGNKREIPSDVRENFNKTGTSHILAISGLHIGIVAATAFFFSSLILKTSEYLMLRFNIIKLASTGAFILVLIYALIAGMGIPVVRASLMALIFLSALVLGKQKDIFNILALAGLIILLVWPEALFDISFQLSFTAVFGIIYLVPRFNNISFSLIISWPSWTQKIIKKIYLSIIICIAATIGTMPLIIFYFNRASAITIIANLITVPLLGTIALALSMAFILSAFISASIAGFFIKLSSFFVQVSVDIITRLAALSWSSFTFTKPTVMEIIIFYLFIFFVVELIDLHQGKGSREGFFQRYPLVLKSLLLASLLFFMVNAVYLFSKDKFSTDLRITAIDVGQGSSTLVRFPGGKKMLIDGGGFADSSFDIGKMVIAPFLYSERINTIDTVVLTHPHPDHLYGLLYITDNFNVKEVWSTGLRSEDEIYHQWEKIIKQKNIKRIFLSRQTPSAEINGVYLNVLWPQNSLEDHANVTNYHQVNDDSLVTKIKYGQISFLFPADISSAVERLLIKSKQDLSSDVLFVPHHG
ncbi:MAG: DNA internalization-related competence protein ComEC/Rec2, partial [Deltaproteobacteria bacterium RBG_19FT_COMBO_43_11]